MEDLEELKSGTNKRVLKVYSPEGQFPPHVVKVVNFSDSSQAQWAAERVELIKNLTHSNIVPIYDCFQNSNQVSIRMKYFQNSLATKINQRKNAWNTTELGPWFKTLLKTFAYFESLNLAHLNIKTTNIFLDESGNLVVGGLFKLLKYPQNHVNSDLYSLGVVFLQMASLDLNPGVTEGVQRVGNPFFKVLIEEMLNSNNTFKQILLKYYGDPKQELAFCNLSIALSQIDSLNVSRNVVYSTKLELQLMSPVDFQASCCEKPLNNYMFLDASQISYLSNIKRVTVRNIKISFDYAMLTTKEGKFQVVIKTYTVPRGTSTIYTEVTTHKNIADFSQVFCKFIGFFIEPSKDSTQYGIVIENYNHSLTAFQNAAQEETCFVIYYLLQAYYELHLNNIVMYELSPEDIVFVSGTVKLSKLPSKIINYSSKYLAPELKQGNIQDYFKLDVYNLGMILYELCINNSVNPFMQEIVSRMLHTDPSQRIDIEGALSIFSQNTQIQFPAPNSFLNKIIEDYRRSNLRSWKVGKFLAMKFPNLRISKCTECNGYILSSSHTLDCCKRSIHYECLNGKLYKLQENSYYNCEKCKFQNLIKAQEGPDDQINCDTCSKSTPVDWLLASSCGHVNCFDCVAKDVTNLILKQCITCKKKIKKLERQVLPPEVYLLRKTDIDSKNWNNMLNKLTGCSKSMM
mgnify:FL=1